jgi:hypothetical protein
MQLTEHRLIVSATAACNCFNSTLARRNENYLKSNTCFVVVLCKFSSPMFPPPCDYRILYGSRAYASHSHLICSINSMFPRYFSLLGYQIRTRYVVTACSICTGIFVTRPAFVALHEATKVPRPPHASLVLGNWEGVDAEGERVWLRFNRWSFASLEVGGERTRGPVSFTDA